MDELTEYKHAHDYWEAEATRLVAEADFAAAQETIRKFRLAENITCVWHITDAFLERTKEAVTIRD